MLSVSGAVFNSLSFSNGAGIHVENLSDPTKQVSNIIKWNTAYQVDNVVCVNLIKLSILVFVLRFFRPKSLRYVIYFMMFAMSTVNIISASFILAQCRPLEKLWNPEKPGYCAPEGFIDPIGYVQCSVNILTDFFCTITPLCILWNVRIKKKLKFAIATLMSLGILASAAGLVRLFTLNTLKSPDYSCEFLRQIPPLIWLTLRYKTTSLPFFFQQSSNKTSASLQRVCQHTHHFTRKSTGKPR